MKMTFKEFKPVGVTGDGEFEDMFYRNEFTGPDGAHYFLLKEEHHTDDDIKKAKAYLRNNFDVLSIQIITEIDEPLRQELPESPAGHPDKRS
jgi:hypothetical protein